MSRAFCIPTKRYLWSSAVASNSPQCGHPKSLRGRIMVRDGRMKTQFRFMHVDPYRLGQLDSCSVNNRGVVSVSVLPSRSRLSQSPVILSRSSPCRLFLEIGHALPCLNSRGLVWTKTGTICQNVNVQNSLPYLGAEVAHVVPGAAVHVGAKAHVLDHRNRT
jgi:hypothetical protein